MKGRLIIYLWYTTFTMNIQPGTFLFSMPSLDDLNFEKVVIFITEHNEKGALGFVINKLFPRRLNELVEFKNSIPVPLYAGGPVEKEHIFFLHRRPDLIEQSIPVTASIYMGGNFKQAVEKMNSGVISPGDFKSFIGYCGWNDNELEEEIAEGSWLVINTPVETVFSHNTEMLWKEMYKNSEDKII